MISNKTVTTLFLVILGMKTVTSTSSNIRGPSSSDAPIFHVRRRRRVSGVRRTVPVLQDTTSVVKDVEFIRKNIKTMSVLQEPSVPQVNKQFDRLIKHEKYEEIMKLGEKMSDKEFMKQLCPVVRTFEQYNEFKSYLKRRDLVATFYVHGDVRVVRKAIIAESDSNYYAIYATVGDLGTALLLALREDHHERVIDLLKAGREVLPEEDRQLAQRGIRTKFDDFVFSFLEYFRPTEENGMALKRVLTFHEDELRSKHPEILDTLCQGLVCCLKDRVDDQNVEKLLTDMIGQSFLLTSVSFAKGFLYYASDRDRIDFILYGWREAIEEGLKEEYQRGGKKLWRTIKRAYPTQAIGVYPPPTDVLTAVLKQFPTKQELEGRWIKNNALNLLKEVEKVLDNIFPKVLIPIITGYARPTWIDV